MDHTKEPYYLDTYNTTIKSFVLPSIIKQNNFVSSIKPEKEKAPESVLHRSNSLEPYFKPSIQVHYNLYESVFFDDDEDEIELIDLHVDSPSIDQLTARDDYDNNVKFDFYL